MKRIIALIITLTVFFTNTIQVLSFSFSIDSPLLDGLNFSESTSNLEDGGDSHTYKFEYFPGKSAFPVVAWGEKQKQRKTLSKIARLYGDNVVGGINADFFSFTTGIPLGCVASEGVFLSSSVNNNALAVFEDGTLHIGNPDIKSSITVGDNTYDFYYNKYPQIYSLYVMDSTYFESTASTFPSLEIVLIPDNDEMRINSTTKCEVFDIIFDTSDTPIPDGAFVLTVPNTHIAYNDFSQLKTGDEITIEISGSVDWERALYIVGGGDVIVKYSEFVPESVDEYSDKVRHARTAVGIREDGSAVFFAVDGKKENHSSGMTLKELAQELISLGAVTALNFDGGGSTTVGVKYIGEEEFEIVNYSTDGYPRSISNAILFLNTATPDGIPIKATLFPNFYFALPNSIIPFEEKFFDSSMTELADIVPIKSSYSVMTQGIDLRDGYVRVLEANVYERGVKADYILDDGTSLRDYKTFYVPQTLDVLNVGLEKQVLDIAEKTNVKIISEFNGFDVISSPSSFSWSFSENNVDELRDGVLAENDVARLYADGSIEILTDDLFTSTVLTATYGDISTSVNVFVGMPDIIIENFEKHDEPAGDSTSEQEIIEELEADTLSDDEVKETLPQTEEKTESGYRSDRAGVLEKGSLVYDSPISLSLIPKKIKLMYKGKYSTPANLIIIDSDGEEITIPYTVSKDYSEINGWTELEAEVPSHINGELMIKAPFVSQSEETAAIDDITACYGFELPVFDDVDTSWAKEYIRNIYDMGLISGYTQDGKLLYAPERHITRAEFAKLISSYQKYIYNPDSYQLNFNDNEDIPEWATEYIATVAENNIMNGRQENDGSLKFAPNSPITRMEVMVVLSRIMEKINGDVQLNFADTTDIPSWALDGVKSVVSAGVITGYDDNTIRPLENISRAEVAVVFSRLYDYMYTD